MPKNKPPTHKPAQVKIKATSRQKTAAADAISGPKNVLMQQKPGFPIIGIGASAGGLEACDAFIKAMPEDSGMAIIIVSHLDPTHASLLPELLQKQTRMPVMQIHEGMPVQANHVYVIPPNRNVSILNGVLYLTKLSLPRGSDLPIDHFFRSLALDQGPNAVVIILSGTGSDGSLGLKEIKAELGMVIAQTETSAKYDGMPRNAIDTGLVDFVLPPEKMPALLTQYMALVPASRLSPLQSDTEASLQKVFAILHKHTEQDFSLYKHNTLCRRIERRMNLHHILDIADYVGFLHENGPEVEILYRELLIGVTRFFRDPDAFHRLRTQELLELLKDKPEDYRLRVWVPGCSTGEEAYSIAILLQECMEEIDRHFSVQLFATDLDIYAVDTARAGIYPASIEADVGKARLRRYFSKEDDGRYRIRKAIREMLIFAPQSVIKDPPFTKLDLISCRNLLIYLGTTLQDRTLSLFHYCLKPDGLLFLGASESLGKASNLFTTLDKKWKLFRRESAVEGQVLLGFPGALRRADMLQEIDASKSLIPSRDISTLHLIEAILNQAEAPPTVIIDKNSDIIYIHGRAGRYLQPAEGKASLNILKMARPGLKSELAVALSSARSHRQETVLKGLRVPLANPTLPFDMTIKPVLVQANVQGLLMITFKDAVAEDAETAVTPIVKETRENSRTEQQLRQELRYSRESLQTTIEELETSNEELNSTNEELQSTNEELQSTNEEMETSKEELQSLNEESYTVNAELQSRINELAAAHDDIKNLLDSTNIATLFLDLELCVRRFTPKATDIIPLTPTDVGRPIQHFVTHLIDVDLTCIAQKALEDLHGSAQEVWSKDQRSFNMRVRPYRTLANVIDGVVLTFEDITQLKRAEAALKKINDAFYTLGNLAPIAIFHTDSNGKYSYVNEHWCQLVGMTQEQAMSTGPFDAVAPADRGPLEQAWSEACKNRLPFKQKYRLQKPTGDRIWVMSEAVPVTEDQGTEVNYIGTLIEIPNDAPNNITEQ